MFFTRLTRSADDAAGVARILGRPRPNTVPEVERLLVEQEGLAPDAAELQE